MAYAEILSGVSIMEVERYGTIYVKHLGIEDTKLLDMKREHYFQKAKRKGLLGEEEKVALLKKEDLWDEEQEEEMAKQKDFVSRLQETKQKLILKSEVANMSKEIEKAQIKIDKIQNERTGLIGLTCEGFADKKANDYYIYLALFKDEQFKKPFFSEEEYDELSDGDLVQLITGFNCISHKFSDINMKRISLSPFFLNNFYLCKDNPFIFFGKPVVGLTYHQADLFANGRYFKHVISELKHSPSPSVMEDPDKLIELYGIQQNKEKMDDGKERTGVASTVVGATKEDLDALGMSAETAEGEVVDLNKELKKKGRTLEMEDIIKLHGV